MRTIFSIAIVMAAFQVHGQTPAQADVLRLSNQIFRWEVENKIDSLQKLFDGQFVVVGGTGESQSKEQYLAVLRAGNFVHDSIDIEQNTASIADNTATVFGKGKFSVTVSGKKRTLHLSYMEVFTRSGSDDPWKVLAMHASILQ